MQFAFSIGFSWNTKARKEKEETFKKCWWLRKCHIRLFLNLSYLYTKSFFNWNFQKNMRLKKWKTTQRSFYSTIHPSPIFLFTSPLNCLCICKELLEIGKPKCGKHKYSKKGGKNQSIKLVPTFPLVLFFFFVRTNNLLHTG